MTCCLSSSNAPSTAKEDEGTSEPSNSRSYRLYFCFPALFLLLVITKVQVQRLSQEIETLKAQQQKQQNQQQALHLESIPEGASAKEMIAIAEKNSDREFDSVAKPSEKEASEDTVVEPTEEETEKAAEAAEEEPVGKIMRREDFPPPPPSPYTKHTGHRLPGQFRKYFFLKQSINRTAGERSVCFVHVGKTAGTTIACYLGFHYRGLEQFVLPKCRLRDQTIHAFHNWVNDCPRDDDYLLFATRDPISRMKSWFTYERPHHMYGKGQEWDQQKRLFLDCPFPTLNALAEQGLGDPRVYTNITARCRNHAFDAIRGYKNYYRHNFYNFEWYLDRVPSKKPVLALRQEFLQQDWISAEHQLMVDANDVRKFNITFPTRNQSVKSDADKYLSEQAVKNLCRVLCKEIQAYKTILNRAVNLTPEEVQESMDILAKECPREVQHSSCDERLFQTSIDKRSVAGHWEIPMYP